MEKQITESLWLAVIGIGRAFDSGATLLGKLMDGAIYLVAAVMLIAFSPLFLMVAALGFCANTVAEILKERER